MNTSKGVHSIAASSMCDKPRLKTIYRPYFSTLFGIQCRLWEGKSKGTLSHSKTRCCFSLRRTRLLQIPFYQPLRKHPRPRPGPRWSLVPIAQPLSRNGPRTQVLPTCRSCSPPKSVPSLSPSQDTSCPTFCPTRTALGGSTVRTAARACRGEAGGRAQGYTNGHKGT